MRQRPNHPGFTLIELLVVIAIIALLIGLLLPMSLKALGVGETARMRADLVSVGSALDAFKQDTGRYPRVDEPGTGFAVLGQALVGFGPANVNPTDTDLARVPLASDIPLIGIGTVGRDGDTTDDVYVAISELATAANFGDNTNWVPFGRFVDGVDGAGFSKGGDGRLTQSPYLAADSFKVRGTALLDINEEPILYYPARPKKPNIHAVPGFISATNASLWNASNNDFDVNDDDVGLLDANQFQILLGDFNLDGAIGAGETATAEGNFVLISPGTDLEYVAVGADAAENRKAVEESDDLVYGN